MGAAVFSQAEISELSISTVRDGHEVVVSAWVHNPAEGPAFHIVDLLEGQEPPRDLLGTVRRALGQAPAEVQAAMWGVSLPAERGRVGAGFTVSVMLGIAPAPGAPEAEDPMDPELEAWEGAEVLPFTLDGHLGQRRSRVITSPPVNGATVPLLTMTYVAGTPYGVLTVAFGTAHIDHVDIFQALFDRIASSVRIVSTAPIRTR